MNKLVVTLVAVIVTVAAVGGYALLSSDNEDNTAITDTATNSESMESTQDSQPELTEYSVQDVAEHNTQSDCWTYIDNSVYDITSYIPRHPGGDDILLACGEDGQSLFNTRTTDVGDKIGSGTPHSSSAQAQLQQLKIGELEN